MLPDGLDRAPQEQRATEAVCFPGLIRGLLLAPASRRLSGPVSQKTSGISRRSPDCHRRTAPRVRGAPAVDYTSSEVAYSGVEHNGARGHAASP